MYHMISHDQHTEKHRGFEKMNETRQQVKLMNMVNGEELEGIGGDVGKQYTKWRVNRDRTGADVVLSGFSCLCFKLFYIPHYSRLL